MSVLEIDARNLLVYVVGPISKELVSPPLLFLIPAMGRKDKHKLGQTRNNPVFKIVGGRFVVKLLCLLSGL